MRMVVCVGGNKALYIRPKNSDTEQNTKNDDNTCNNHGGGGGGSDAAEVDDDPHSNTTVLVFFQCPWMCFDNVGFIEIALARQ